MNKQQPRTDERLRKELEKAGAREYEVVALTLVPERGLAALEYALKKGADHPVAYAIKLFDSEEWSPSGEKPRRGTNLHVGGPSPIPPPRREANLDEARKILAKLRAQE